MRSRKLFSAAALLALLATAVFGQEYRGRIQGTIMDSSTAAIPGAKVTLLNNLSLIHI